MFVISVPHHQHWGRRNKPEENVFLQGALEAHTAERPLEENCCLKSESDKKFH